MPRATQQGGAEDSLAGCGLGKKVGSGSFCEVPDLQGLFPSYFPRILCKTQSSAVLQLTLSSNRDLPPVIVCAASCLLHVTVQWRVTAPALSLPGAQSAASTATIVIRGSLKVWCSSRRFVGGRVPHTALWTWTCFPQTVVFNQKTDPSIRGCQPESKNSAGDKGSKGGAAGKLRP